jgi:hypothetical protein
MYPISRCCEGEEEMPIFEESIASALFPWSEPVGLSQKETIRPRLFWSRNGSDTTDFPTSCCKPPSAQPNNETSIKSSGKGGNARKSIPKKNSNVKVTDWQRIGPRAERGSSMSAAAQA